MCCIASDSRCVLQDTYRRCECIVFASSCLRPLLCSLLSLSLSLSLQLSETTCEQFIGLFRATAEVKESREEALELESEKELITHQQFEHLFAELNAEHEKGRGGTKRGVTYEQFHKSFARVKARLHAKHTGTNRKGRHGSLASSSSGQSKTKQRQSSADDEGDGKSTFPSHRVASSPSPTLEQLPSSRQALDSVNASAPQPTPTRERRKTRTRRTPTVHNEADSTPALEALPSASRARSGTRAGTDTEPEADPRPTRVRRKTRTRRSRTIVQRKATPIVPIRRPREKTREEIHAEAANRVSALRSRSHGRRKKGASKKMTPIFEEETGSDSGSVEPTSDHGMFGGSGFGTQRRRRGFACTTAHDRHARQGDGCGAASAQAVCGAGESLC